jgi:thymidylate synthase (FAD)
MKITPVAQTQITTIPESLRGTDFMAREDWGSAETSDIDLLAEMAGRSCYKSWTMPNPATAENEGYIENILEHGHYSVLEHGSVTFYVEGVSRALLLELERHRFTQYSVESQRYVNTRKHHPEAVVPPVFRPYDELKHILQVHYDNSLDLYDQAYNFLRDKGHGVKESREGSRSLLLESTPVDLFVTANIRAWRDVMGKRWSTHADAEIQEFAGKILEHLKTIAPNSVLDIADEPAN